MGDRLQVTATGMYDPPVKDGGKVIRNGILTPWRSNAELIAEGCVRLGWVRTEDRLIDPTWGKGNWWTAWSPEEPIRHHDIEQDGIDFRKVPYGDSTFSAAAFDPPYVCPGGLDSSTIKEFLASYGMSTGGQAIEAERLFSNPDELHEMNAEGLVEMVRVVEPRGRILLKTANYVWSGRLFMGAHKMVEEAENLGCTVLDSFVYVGSPRAQPSNRTRKCPTCGALGSIADAVDGKLVTIVCPECDGAKRVPSPQVHARQNVSYLHVLGTPKKKPSRQGILA